jgi:hypothetical protein
MIDRAGLSTRVAADQLGHSKPSMTQDRYMNRDLQVTAGAQVLDVLGGDTGTGHSTIDRLRVGDRHEWANVTTTSPVPSTSASPPGASS